MTGLVLTVTPNPAVDITWHTERIVEGGSHRVAAGLARAGGKGLNVARVVHQMGSPTLAVAAVGGATGGEFTAELAASGVPHRLVPSDAATRRTIAIVDEHTGDATIFNERGADPGPAAREELHQTVVAASKDAGALVVSGSLPPGMPVALVEALVRIAQERGIPSIVDSSGDALLAAARAGATVLKPNRAELAEATGVDDELAAARALLGGGTRLVLVSLGADGMLAVSADGAALHARLPEVLAGNPTGAGDAAVAAASVLLARGATAPEELLRAAVAWSAAAVLEPVAGAISPRHAEFAGRIVVRPYPPETL